MRLAVIASLAAALGAAPILAADRPPASSAGWQRPNPEQMAARRAAMAAKRSTDIALLLGLRADQKPALDGYLAALHPRGMHDRHDHDRAAGGASPAGSDGTIASLDRMNQRIDARDAEAKQRIAATRSFYASLTPDQQQRFDAMAQLMHGRLGHEGTGGRGEGRHDMHSMG